MFQHSIGLSYRDLTPSVRDHMVSEFDRDVETGNLYEAPRVLPHKKSEWLAALRQAAEQHDDAWLTSTIKQLGLLCSFDIRQGKQIKLASDAAENLAQGEFNRLYVRGVCLHAIAINHGVVFAYRARYSKNPRPDSEAILGRGHRPEDILSDLRTRQGEDTLFGIPNGPNSGLSAYLCDGCGPQRYSAELIVCRCARR